MVDRATCAASASLDVALMPRRGRGGARQGTPGQSYGQRTDLQANKLPVTTVPGQQYGQGVAQQRAQQAVPMGAPPSPAPAPAAAGPGAPSRAPGPLPGQVTPLDAPTQRPNEPLTAGLPMGPGAGPEALGPYGAGGAGEDVATQLRAIYSRFPNEDLRGLIELLDDEDG